MNASSVFQSRMQKLLKFSTAVCLLLLFLFEFRAFAQTTNSLFRAKKVQESGSSILLPQKVRLLLSSAPPESVERAAAQLWKVLRKHPEFQPEFVLSDQVELEPVDICIGKGLTNQYVINVLSKGGTTLVLRPESFVLSFSSEGFAVWGSDDNGVFFGCMELAQLLERTPNALKLPECEIKDFPSRGLRAVWLSPDRENLPLVKQLMQQVLPKCRLNHIILNLENVVWFEDLSPSDSQSISILDLKGLGDIARDKNLAVIPHFESFAQTVWAAKLAQDATPSVFTPLKPVEYTLLLKVYQEILQIFDPHYFHIGFERPEQLGPTDSSTSAEEMASETLSIRRSFLRLKNILQVRGIQTFLSSERFMPTEVWAAPSTAGYVLSATQAKVRRNAVAPDESFFVMDWDRYFNAEQREGEIMDEWHDEKRNIVLSIDATSVWNHVYRLPPEKIQGGVYIFECNEDSLASESAGLLAASKFLWEGQQTAESVASVTATAEKWLANMR